MTPINDHEQMDQSALTIVKQGAFSSGGTVTTPVAGEYDPTTNWLELERHGTTAHVDHANVFYQIPANDNHQPIVYLHGYGQSRMGWLTTPDGRDGWATDLLRAGHAAFLVDQPRRGEAGNTTAMTMDGMLDAWAEDSKFYKPGDQAWYTHFRIGRVAPERYEGSQFPAGEEVQNQFFRQMTPNTRTFDVEVVAAGLNAVLADVAALTGDKPIYLVHSQGGTVAWVSDYDHVAALIAVEPGGAPEVGDETYQKLLANKIPVLFIYGDYIDNGPADIQSTQFWQGARDAGNAFVAAYTADGGTAQMWDLPKMGITGNSHFMFQEENSQELSSMIADWLAANVK